MIIEKFSKFSNNVLLIVDVQKSFSKFFTDKYVNEIKKYCHEFTEVFQIWDNHVNGKVDKNYLYDINPDIPIHSDLYHFPNQKDLIEKRYNYNVNIDFYKNILDKNTYSEIKYKENFNLLKKGSTFKTKRGTYITFIGNKHRWYHIGLKLVNLFISLKGKSVTIVGGSDSECLEDIITSARSFGIDIERNWKFLYSANHCPIK